jgi:hypothetical protein
MGKSVSFEMNALSVTYLLVYMMFSAENSAITCGPLLFYICDQNE